MTDKNDNPELDPDSSQPDPAEDTASSSDQENVKAESAEEKLSPVENVDTGPAGEEFILPDNLEEKLARPNAPAAPGKSFSFTPLLLILVLAAVGGGGYWIHKEQTKLHQEVQTGFNQMASRLDTVEADMQRLQNNQQQLATFNRSLQDYQSEAAETFQSQQNSLSTLDEDVIRLKEELRHLAETQAAQPAAGGRARPAGEAPELIGSDSALHSTTAGNKTKPELSASPARGQTERAAQGASEGPSPAPLAAGNDRAGPAGEAPELIGSDSVLHSTTAGGNTQDQPAQAELNDRSPEAQEYIDFVESTTGRFFRLIQEGFSKLWQWFASLFQ